MTKISFIIYTIASLLSLYSACFNYELGDYGWMVWHMLLTYLFGHWAIEEWSRMQLEKK